ncbi:riboflavin transporter MCH5 [Verticillium alfalfae VaMs.102]|uniref:Riboflavin transporter MCH5 n=1 Tax=Verticillium alfalfae (strain VaMs.102 / ATCC MYA-4576 / FGSC 10136) TaxID=526221 RepID=C9SKU7_VERA1|nr:riboflavin transporter MCH5 [Verticillium alfalfae VaMs.102]EEY19315.1 riboflavin transporter MCH5 [Verticillium alfalfae VaMs.102]
MTVQDQQSGAMKPDTGSSPEGHLQESGDEELAYPEGGLDAWLVVLGAWCAMIPSMGLLNTMAVLHAYVSENQLSHISQSASGWIFSIYAFLLYFCGAQVEYYQFILSFGVLGEISASLLFYPSIAAIGHWFDERRALATGIACTAGGFGGIAFPLIILYSAPRIGFGWSIRIIGFICTASCLAACFLIKKRLPTNRSGGSSIDLKALRDPKFGVTTLAVFCAEFACFVPYTYISSYAIHAGMGAQAAYLLNTLLNAGAVLGRALPGYVADSYGAFNIMSITVIVCTIIIYSLWFNSGSNEAMIQAFTVLFGFWSGAAISLTPVCIGRVSETKDLGKRSGTAFCVSSFAGLTGIPIAGAILEANVGSYRGLILLTGGFYVATSIAFIVARGVTGGWHLKAVV